ncbi:MAG: DNA polymerase III subunit delta [Pseudomonadota bacterium]
MQLKASEIDAYIRNIAGYHRVILVYGPDQGLVSERVNQLQSNVLSGNEDPFAALTLDSDEIAADPARLMDEAATVGLFGGDRFIRIRIQGNRPITKSIQAALDQDQLDAKIVLDAGNLRKGHQLRTLIERDKKAVAIPCYADDGRSLRRLIEEALSENQIIADQEAITTLIAHLGEDRRTTRNEVEKVCLYAGEGGRLTAADILMLVGDASSNLVDETVDNILTGNVEAGLKSFRKAILLGQDGFQTASALQRHLLLLNIKCDDYEKGSSAKAVVDQMRPPVHFSRKPAVIQQIQLWSTNDIERTQNQVSEAIIQSRMKPDLAVAIVEGILVRIAAMIRAKNRKNAHNRFN